MTFVWNVHRFPSIATTTNHTQCICRLPNRSTGNYTTTTTVCTAAKTVCRCRNNVLCRTFLACFCQTHHLQYIAANIMHAYARFHHRRGLSHTYVSVQARRHNKMRHVLPGNASKRLHRHQFSVIYIPSTYSMCFAYYVNAIPSSANCHSSKKSAGVSSLECPLTAPPQTTCPTVFYPCHASIVGGSPSITIYIYTMQKILSPQLYIPYSISAAFLLLVVCLLFVPCTPIDLSVRHRLPPCRRRRCSLSGRVKPFARSTNKPGDQWLVVDITTHNTTNRR